MHNKKMPALILSSRSQSTAFAVANINRYKSRTCAFFATSHRFRDIHFSKFITLKLSVNVIAHKIRSCAIRWQIPEFISNSNSNICIFQRLLVYTAIWKVWPWKLRSRSWVQHSQWSHSMENINLYTSHTWVFSPALVNRDINISKYVTLKI